jgi:hypothetical protein
MHWVKARVKASTPTPFRHWTVTLWTVRLAQGTPVLDGVNSADRDGLGRQVGIGSQFDSTCARSLRFAVLVAQVVLRRLAGNERKSLSGSSSAGPKPLIWKPEPVRQRL